MKSLRNYQSYGVLVLEDMIKKGAQEVGLYFVMGAGKTITSLALMCHVSAGRTFLVATPQNSISQGWVSQSLREYVMDKEKGKVVLKFPEVTQFGSSGDSASEFLKRTLSVVGTDKFEGGVINYNPLAEFLSSRTPEELRPEISGRVLICDEGHHTWKDVADDLSDGELDVSTWKNIREKWKAAGGVIVLATATPHEDDYDIPHVEYPFIKQMWAGLAPSQLIFDSIHAESFEDRVRLAVDRWEQDGKPATIVQIKQGSSEQNQSRVDTVVRAFAERGVRVVDAYGEQGGTNLKRAMDEYIQTQEGGGPLNFEALPRVFVAIGRLGEGTDVPWVSNILFFGIPKKALRFDQGLGRTLRFRRRIVDGPALFEGYPEEWLDKSQVIFVTKKEDDHAQNWLAVCQRLVSYRNASLLMANFSSEDRPVPLPASLENGKAFFRNVALEKLCHEALDLARAFLDSLPPPSFRSPRSLLKVALRYAGLGPEGTLPPDPALAQKFQEYSSEDVKTHIRAILRAPGSFMDESLPPLDMPPAVLEAFSQIRSSGSRWEVDKEVIHHKGALAHGWDPASLEPVKRCLRQYLDLNRTWPRKRDFSQLYRHEAGILVMAGTALGDVALQLAAELEGRPRDPWYDIFSAQKYKSLGAAHSPPPEIVYFRGCSQVVRLERPVLRSLDIEEADLLGSIPQKHLKTLVEILEGPGLVGSLRSMLRDENGKLSVSAFKDAALKVIHADKTQQSEVRQVPLA